MTLDCQRLFVIEGLGPQLKNLRKAGGDSGGSIWKKSRIISNPALEDVVDSVGFNYWLSVSRDSITQDDSGQRREGGQHRVAGQRRGGRV
jgi:hypothetical protein